MGKSPEAIPNRLARGEARRRRHHGRLCAGRPDQAGQGHPRIARRAGRLAYRRGRARRLGKTRRRFPEGLKQALLHAKSIAYSDSASGVYIERELFRKLGIEDQAEVEGEDDSADSGGIGRRERRLRDRLPAGERAAAGQGATFVGKIPESLQSVTRFAAGIPVGAQHPAEAKALLDYLASPDVQADVKSTGLDSVPAH